MSFEPFHWQPELEGRLLRLRPLEAEDFPGLLSIAEDPLIWEQHPVRDRYKPGVFRQFFEEALKSGGALAALDLADGQLIGSSRFDRFDEEACEIEIGWSFLARTHWGGAFNGEMKRLMLRHAFRFVDNVLFRIGPQNIRSQKAVEKIGAIRIGVRIEEDGKPNLLYRISKADWPLTPGSGAR